MDIEPLQDRAVVRDLVMLICALVHLGDRTAWLAVLRAPWTGLTLSDLLIVARSGPIVWDALCDEGVLANLSADGVRRCGRLKRILEDAFRVRSHTGLPRWVERTWLALGGAACAGDARGLAHVRTVFARLRDLDEREFPDAADLVGRFADLYADGGAESAVEIMTIHKAKGLEFDLVIVPALDRHARPSATPLLLTHQFARTERDGMVMAARPPVGAEPDRLFDFLRGRPRTRGPRSAAAAVRRLHARKAELYLTARGIARRSRRWAETNGENAEESDRGPSSLPGEPLEVLWPAAGEQFAIDAPARRPGAEATVGLARRPVARGCLEAGHRAATSRCKATCPPGSGEREETPVIFDWAGETARRVGSSGPRGTSGSRSRHSDEAAVRSREGHFKPLARSAGRAR